MNNIKSPLSNIMEIMNIVIKRIETSGQDKNGNDPMVSQLLAKGFSLNDIDTAMGLVAMITSKVDPIVRVSEREKNQDGQLSGIRQLHALEALRLTPDAQKYLLKSLEEGSITPLQFEKSLLYLQKMDLRGVNKTRLEIILLMNKPVNEAHLEDDESFSSSFYPTIH
ncbi:MAG: hypothetical protein II961_06605 [Candidatus Riflebacteria bacterium]|nr:hypothetical protein [Candidatus Riflebacteria bacterium]